jgi:hypothetical protein
VEEWIRFQKICFGRNWKPCRRKWVPWVMDVRRPEYGLNILKVDSEPTGRLFWRALKYWDILPLGGYKYSQKAVVRNLKPVLPWHRHQKVSLLKTSHLMALCK